jgi:hypothetical protein
LSRIVRKKMGISTDRHRRQFLPMLFRFSPQEDPGEFRQLEVGNIGGDLEEWRVHLSTDTKEIVKGLHLCKRIGNLCGRDQCPLKKFWTLQVMKVTK